MFDSIETLCMGFAIPGAEGGSVQLFTDRTVVVVHAHAASPSCKVVYYINIIN